jgi:hypothetical protein
MAKIDILTLTGFTATDGSIIASGATIKFNSEFNVRSTNIMIRPKVYRNRELFDLGYDEVKTNEIPNEFILAVPENEFYTLTPAILYQKVCDYLNDWYGTDVFEVKIIA